jgi:hypothetical protein
MHQKVVSFTLPDTDFSASRTSSAINVSQVAAFCAQVEITATGLSGTLKLQVSNLETSGFTDLPDATITYTTQTATLNWVFIEDVAPYQFVRLVWTRTAGSGTCTIANIGTKAV